MTVVLYWSHFINKRVYLTHKRAYKKQEYLLIIDVVYIDDVHTDEP